MSKLSDSLKDSCILPDEPKAPSFVQTSIDNEMPELNPSKRARSSNISKITVDDIIKTRTSSKATKMILIDDEYKNIIENLSFVAKVPQSSIINNMLAAFLDLDGNLSIRHDISNYINDKFKI